ncbi:hypothetical protein OQA88_10873 [Cercophora sp. LCS_1]
MAKLLAVFGATGHQGSSIINFVLNNPSLSQQYKIRAITRDGTSPKATRLTQQGVEVIQADMNDPTSLTASLSGVHTVFIMTVPNFKSEDPDDQLYTAKKIADTAVQQGAEYIIFSTLPNYATLSGGKYTKVFPFDAKAKAEEYIRTLPVKSAFYCPGIFMENFQDQPYIGPKKRDDGTWAVARHYSPATELPLIDATGDTGKFVGAMLAEPEKYEGKTVAAAQGVYTIAEAVEIISKATGKKVVYEQVSEEEFRKSLPFEGPYSDVFVEGFGFQEEYGYFGPGTRKSVAEASSVPHGRLRTLEEFLETHPLILE